MALECVSPKICHLIVGSPVDTYLETAAESVVCCDPDRSGDRSAAALSIPSIAAHFTTKLHTRDQADCV